MDRHILQLLQEGATSVSNLLLKTYKRMSLTDEEMMLMIHLLSFQQEGTFFPTIQELEERMSVSHLRLIQLLQKLLKEEWLSIDEYSDPQTGLRHERYNLEPLHRKLVLTLREQFSMNRIVDSYTEGYVEIAAGQERQLSIYSHFEQAFGRPLSPFEMETIQIWTQQDCYSEELIVTALREATSVGKLYIRYIDRILLEWQRQQITSVEGARDYSLRFRRQSSSRDQRQPL